MDKVGFLQVKKRNRQCIYILKLQVYATLDPTTGIPPLELKLYKLLQINILKKTHLNMAK